MWGTIESIRFGRRTVAGVVCAMVILALSATANARLPQSPTPDVVNGEPVAADSEEFHSIVALLTNYDPSSPASKYFNQYCGGTLIKPRLVLTAAVCVNEFSSDYPKYVAVGTTDLEADSGEVVAVTARRVWHATDIGGPPHDLALVELAEPVHSVTPASRLTDTNAPITGTAGLIAGWGADENEDFPVELQQAAVAVLSSEACTSLYGSDATASSYFCAAHLDDVTPRDVCVGDAGGPVMVDTLSGPRLAGVNVFDETCGEYGSFGLYQRTSAFDTWIYWASLVHLHYSSTQPDFAQTVLGSPLDRSTHIRITNNGGATAKISSQQVNGSAFSTNGGCGAGVELQPGQFCDLYVSFRPTVAGQSVGSIELKSNNSSGAVQTIPLRGFALEAGVPRLYFSRAPRVRKTRRSPRMGFDVAVNHDAAILNADPNACTGTAEATITFRGIRKKFRTRTDISNKSNSPNGSTPATCVAWFALNVPEKARKRRARIEVKVVPNIYQRAGATSKTFKPRWFKKKRRR